MPKQVAQSGLFKKLGTVLAKAHEAHKADETEFSTFGELPPGINGGIAQLVDCKFDTYKKGEFEGQFFFYAAGTVHLPIEHEGIRTEGLRTSIMEPLCDTPNKSRKTVADHLGWIYNELRKLGLSTEDLDFKDLESEVATLKETQPFFRFRTWQGEATPEFPNPRINHQWNGEVDFNPDDDAGAATEDETEAPEPLARPAKTAKTPANGKAAANGKPTQVAKNAATTTQKTAGKKASAPPEPEEEPEVSGDQFDEFGDLDSLAELANNKNDDAQQKLTDLAVARGATQEDIDNAPNWEAVVEMITATEEEKAGQEQEQEEAPEQVTEEPEPEVEPTPEKEQVYAFKPLDPKTKKRVKKAIECEVTAVDTTKKTVSLKSLDNPKIVYNNVKWELLEKIGG